MTLTNVYEKETGETWYAEGEYNEFDWKVPSKKYVEWLKDNLIKTCKYISLDSDKSSDTVTFADKVVS